MKVSIGIPSVGNGLYLHISALINGSHLRWKVALSFLFFFNLFPFSLWQINICFRIANCCCLFSASVTASRWRNPFSSKVSLAFPYSPVARLSPYSNGINTPSFSKTSNKAILTPERTGNLSTSWLAMQGYAEKIATVPFCEMTFSSFPYVRTGVIPFLQLFSLWVLFFLRSLTQVVAFFTFVGDYKSPVTAVLPPLLRFCVCFCVYMRAFSVWYLYSEHGLYLFEKNLFDYNLKISYYWR